MFGAAMVSPLYSIDPSFIFCNPTIDLPSVVLPHPDCPTRPKVSPSFISNDMLSTAVKLLVAFPKILVAIGKRIET